MGFDAVGILGCRAPSQTQLFHFGRVDLGQCASQSSLAPSVTRIGRNLVGVVFFSMAAVVAGGHGADAMDDNVAVQLFAMPTTTIWTCDLLKRVRNAMLRCPQENWTVYSMTFPEVILPAVADAFCFAFVHVLVDAFLSRQEVRRGFGATLKSFSLRCIHADWARRC